MIISWKSYLGTKISDNRGQGMIEYVFLASLIALVVMITLGILGIKLVDLYNSFTSSF